MDCSSIRENYILNTGWKFKLGEEPKAWYKGFDDSSWRDVNIPHDWAVEHPFDINCSSGTGYLPGGKGYYRKAFFLPKKLKGKQVFITFDGVYKNSMVWCNSYYLGKRPNGYTQFCYDITDFVCFGDDPNVIVVKVQHEDIADSRWYTGSGIYRKVTVTVKDKIAIENNSVFIYTAKAEKEQAEILVQMSVSNAQEADAEISARHILYDRNRPVASSQNHHCVGAGGRVNDYQVLTVNNPILWSPDNPCLYTCVTEIERDGKIIDREKTVIGIRTFSFDPDNGFFLNGKSMKIKGVCVHHDAGCLGAAVRKKVWERRLKALKEMGCNAIRMSHNPHMPELYDLCDSMGFLVIDEAFDEWEGVKNKWVKGHNVYPPAHYGYYEDFPKWHEEDLSAMILRDRNHPSVILWSIGNEVDYPNDPYCSPLFKEAMGNNDRNKPLAERLSDPNKPDAKRLVTVAKKLVSIVKKHDNTRPVTAALAFPDLSNAIGLSDCLDVVGYNYMEHLYEEDHKRYPNKIILGTENIHGIEQWLEVAENDFISGQFLWTGVDFLGETQGWPCHGSKSGLLDVAGFKKPSYYFRQSLWSEKPMVKLFTSDMIEEAGGDFDRSHDLISAWDYKNGQDILVVCYTNCEQTELFINNRSAGIKRLGDCGKGYLTWIVPFEKGELKAVSIDKNGLTHECVILTTGKAAKIKLTCADTLISADGSDMTHIIAEIVDSDGNRVSHARNRIRVTVEGEGYLMGLENGDLRDLTPYSENYRNAYKGRLLIYVSSGCKSDLIKVTAESDGLISGEAVIECK